MFIYMVYVCMCVCVPVHIPQCTHGSQKKTYGSMFSPSIMWAYQAWLWAPLPSEASPCSNVFSVVLVLLS